MTKRVDHCTDKLTSFVPLFPCLVGYCVYVASGGLWMIWEFLEVHQKDVLWLSLCIWLMAYNIWLHLPNGQNLSISHAYISYSIVWYQFRFYGLRVVLGFPTNLPPCLSFPLEQNPEFT